MTETTLKELILLITPRRFGDQRGFFAETYNHQKYAEMEINVEFVQDNHSLSHWPSHEGRLMKHEEMIKIKMLEQDNRVMAGWKSLHRFEHVI